MRKIIILGQSVTAIKAVEQIRAVDQESEIVMVGFTDGLPALLERFPEWISRQVDAEQVIYKNEKFYNNLRIECLNGRKISRINVSRKTIFFEDKTKLSADILVIADSEKAYFPDVKGWNRDGVFSLKTADQIARLQGMLGRIDTVIIESLSLRGVMFAKALLAQNKEVIFCIPSGCILPGWLEAEIAEYLIMLLQQAGMRVIRNGSVTEILGDDDVKAARLTMGKVIACEAVIFPDALPDMRSYFKDGLAGEQFISVDALLQTSCPGVFAVDELTEEGSRFAQFFDYDSLRQYQSARLFAGMTGADYLDPVMVKHICMNIAGRELLFIGDICPQQAEVFTVRDENGLIRARIFLKNDVVLGAFLVDNTNAGNHISQLIKLGQGIDWETDEFFSTQVGEKKTFAQENNNSTKETALPIHKEMAAGFDDLPGEQSEDEGQR